ncbi:MAG: gamma-glutamyltransferase [Desulfobacterales bacterium]|nr:gamma-glutamyltransferase [Desulfobacterales bacterium]
MKTAFTKHRPLVMGANWMITADHPLAAQAGAAVLQEGGNAVDAAIAANAVLGVVRPHMSGLGGDLFALVYWSGDKKVIALNGSGRSPLAASPGAFLRKGETEIPLKGVLSATVPGVIDAWGRLLDRFGTMGFDRLLARAADLAENGFPVYRGLTDAFIQEESILKRFESGREIFFPRGRAPRPGELLVQKDLAASLKKIIRGGRDVFYRGELGEAFIRCSRAMGGLFAMEDLESHGGAWGEPIGTDYRGLTLLTHPPNSQGVAWLMMANMVEAAGSNHAALEAPDHVHFLVEAKKLVFADRDHYVGDPGIAPAPLARLLDKNHARERAKRIDMERAATGVNPDPSLSGGEDTVYLAVVDGDGNAVSLIQSLYEEFGSGVVIDGTGILLHNRGRDFRMDPDHVNCIAGRKRPYHTLTPGMIIKDGRPFIILGTPGADGQTQTLLQITRNMIDLGADPQEAVEAPRWRSNPDDSLWMEGRFPDKTIEELKRRGHDLTVKPDFDPLCGSAQAILISEENGVLAAGSDPRRQAYAIGY